MTEELQKETQPVFHSLHEGNFHGALDNLKRGWNNLYTAEHSVVTSPDFDNFLECTYIMFRRDASGNDLDDILAEPQLHHRTKRVIRDATRITPKFHRK